MKWEQMYFLNKYTEKKIMALYKCTKKKEKITATTTTTTATT